ncbi:MAG: uracil-DNA glycosylase family protein [Actinomycetota bacterium]|nr:uracil-DNA glycosylase family protein [Actinomycetota bacterium]
MQNSCRKSFDELNKEVLECKKCGDLIELRKNPVPGVGALNARIIIVSDYPRKDGAEITGIPFTNDESGLLIRKIIEDSSLSLENDIYLTYLVKCTPKKKVSTREGEKISNFAPKKIHKENCVPYLIKEITISTPHLLISLGLDTTKFILKYFFSINKKFENMDDLHMKIFKNPSFKLVPFYQPDDVTIHKKITMEKYIGDFETLSKLLKVV